MRWRFSKTDLDPIVQCLTEAMRYYCLWIYACNAVLFASVLVFVGYWIAVVSDYRLGFIPYIKFYHPTLLYAYVAVMVQGGLIQVLGCYAARRLDEKLLNIYWLLLLGLIVGDAVVGVVWIVRYDRISKDMIPLLQNQLYSSYGIDLDFTRRWDRLQVESKCCGISGPLDYNSTPAFTRSGGLVSGQVAALMTDASSKEQNDGVGSVENGLMPFFVPATCCHPSQAQPMQLTLNVQASDEAHGTTPRFEASTRANTEFDFYRAEREGNVRRRRLSNDLTASPQSEGFLDIPDDILLERHSSSERRPSVAPELRSFWKSNQGMKLTSPIFVEPHPQESLERKRRQSNHRYRHWQQKPSSHRAYKLQGAPPPPIAASDILDIQHVKLRAQKDGGTTSSVPRYNFTCLDGHLAPNMEAHPVGCGPELMAWVSKSADHLFVLGFCVIAFIKLCFLGLLRYEIQEMIQKIKVLRAEGTEGSKQSEYAEIAAAFGAAAATQAQTSAATANHVPFVPTPQTTHAPNQNSFLLGRRTSKDSRVLADLVRENTVVVDVGDGRRPSLIISSSPPPPLREEAEPSQSSPPDDAWRPSSEQGTSTRYGFDDASSSEQKADEKEAGEKSTAYLARPSNFLSPLQLPDSVRQHESFSEKLEGKSEGAEAPENAQERNKNLRDELHEMSELLRLTGHQHTEV